MPVGPTNRRAFLAALAASLLDLCDPSVVGAGADMSGW